MTDSRCQPICAELWQERAPQGPWFVSTPHDDHIFFGADTDSAKQCVSAINRPAEEIATLKARIEELSAKALEMRNAIDMIEGALMGMGDLTDLPRRWGEPRHRPELGVKLPTTAGEVYRVCDALSECNRIINAEEYNPDQLQPEAGS